MWIAWISRVVQLLQVFARNYTDKNSLCVQIIVPRIAIDECRAKTDFTRYVIKIYLNIILLSF
jgi:hypothetical protein